MTLVGAEAIIGDPPEIPVLTPTVGQYRVLVELCRDGATDRIIGRRLYITEHTVKCHIKRLLAKTPYVSRTELVVAILRREITVEVPKNLSMS